MKIAAAAAVIVLMFAGSIAGSYALGLHALGQSQQNWCSTLTLLTAKPVPKPTDPAANPSRQGAYLFYRNLMTLASRFGCPR